MLTSPLQILLIALVVLIAAATLPFAVRSLRGDRRGPLTIAAIGVMLAATAAVALAPDPLWFAVLWSAGTAATLAALGSSGGSAALRRGAPWLLAADVLLWIGTMLVVADIGSGSAAAILLVAAAAVRCALLPAHGWLVDSLHAATPVSAALHGGIVNGGGILVLAHAGTIGAEPIATIGLAILAGSAVVLGSLAALVRTDVKGRLVMSTVAQLGFMLLMAASGLLAAAALHLVAHGLYKSALFLGSTGVVDARAARLARPARPPLSPAQRIRRTLLGVAAAVIPLGLVLPLYPARGTAAEVLLLAVLAVAVGAAGAAAVRIPRSAVGLTATVAIVSVATAAFAAVTALLTRALQLPAIAEPAPVAVAGLTLLAVVGIAAVRRFAPRGPLAHRLLALGWAIGSGTDRTSEAIGRPGSRGRSSRLPSRLDGGGRSAVLRIATPEPAAALRSALLPASPLPANPLPATPLPIRHPVRSSS